MLSNMTIGKVRTVLSFLLIQAVCGEKVETVPEKIGSDVKQILRQTRGLAEYQACKSQQEGSGVSAAGCLQQLFAASAQTQGTTTVDTTGLDSSSITQGTQLAFQRYAGQQNQVQGLYGNTAQNMLQQYYPQRQGQGQSWPWQQGQDSSSLWQQNQNGYYPSQNYYPGNQDLYSAQQNTNPYSLQGQGQTGQYPNLFQQQQQPGQNMFGQQGQFPYQQDQQGQYGSQYLNQLYSHMGLGQGQTGVHLGFQRKRAEPAKPKGGVYYLQLSRDPFII